MSYLIIGFLIGYLVGVPATLYIATRYWRQIIERIIQL